MSTFIVTKIPIILLITGLLIYFGISRGIRRGELIIISLCLIVIMFFGPNLLYGIAAGELGYYDTSILIYIVCTVGAFAWIIFRTRKRMEAKKKPMSGPVFKQASEETPLSKKQTAVPSSQKLSFQSRALIFISYRRSDSSDVTGRIYDRLIQHFSAEAIFKDVDSIPLGMDFRKQLSDSVGQCKVLLVIIGRSWLAGEGTNSQRAIDNPRDFVRIELESAFQRGIPIIPLLIQGATVPLEEELPSSLQSLAYHNGMAIRPDPDFHNDMNRLIKGLEVHIYSQA